MKLNHLTAAAIIAASAFSAAAQVSTTPGARIDAYTSETEFKSILVDDIRAITYVGDEQTGYTAVKITTYSGNDLTMTIDDYQKLVFNNVDPTIPHELKGTATPHGRFALLYNFNDPDSPNPIDPSKPWGWQGDVAGRPVFFNAIPKMGYTVDYTVNGVYTGFNYSSVKDFCQFVEAKDTQRYGLGVDCMRFTMPYEPVELVMTEAELDDYAGLPVLGTYPGIRLGEISGRLASGRSGEAMLELKANTTLVFTTDEGDKSIEQTDRYTYDDQKREFVNIPNEADANRNPIDMEVLWGVSGVFSDRGPLWITASYIPDAVTGNIRKYVAMDRRFDYALADADDFGYRRLLEMKPEGGAPVYTLLEQYGYDIIPVEMEFTAGSTIGAAPCDAYIIADGKRVYRYVLAEGRAPEFIKGGAEGGVYSGAMGNLTLDGFGKATLGGNDYGYTLEGGKLTLTAADGSTAYTLTVDNAARTYRSGGNDAWTGPSKFRTDNAVYSRNGSSERAGATIELKLDMNVNDSSNPGYAVVIIDVPRADGTGNVREIASGGNYTYDAAAGTLTVANVICYIDPDSSGSPYYKRVNYVFHVSADLRSAWLDPANIGPHLYTATSTATYVLTGETTRLTAQ